MPAHYFEVVGAVTDGDLLVKAADSLNPDVIVVDVAMPVMNGLQATEHLKDNGCRAKIVFVTVFAEHAWVDACFAAGANGYVSKVRVAADLVKAINEVLAGRNFSSNSR